MQLGMTLGYMYPYEPVPPMNYEVVSGGITYWNAAVLGPRPTEQQLQDAWLPALKTQKRLEIRRAAFTEQDTYLAPGYEDRDYIHIILAAVQNKPDPRQAALLNIKTKLDSKLAEINAATTEAEVEAVTWT